MTTATTADRAGVDAPSVPDVLGIVTRMKVAQRRGGAPTHDERIAALERLEAAVVAHKRAFAASISRDFGSRSSHETMLSEILLVLNGIRHAKTHLRDWMEIEDREVGWLFLPSTAQVVPRPVGVVGIISPWNFPVLLALSPLTAALAAGNRAVLKPSELVPTTADLLREVIAGAFADDEVTVVTGGPEVGEAFCRVAFDHLVFTGSTRVGKLVMRAASENLVPVTLELGGKSPVIVGTDGSMRVAADRIMAGKLLNAGQSCIAPDYAIVPAATRDAFVDACQSAVVRLYPTLVDNPDYTTIVNDEHLARLRRYVEDARAQGATIIEVNPAREALDGTRTMAPVLVVDPTDAMLVMKSEIFGPILPITTYRTVDEAIAYVNDHPHPLALYYFGRGRAAADRIIAETTSGGVATNETMLHFAQDDLPFGGVGPSGMGRCHGREGFDTMTNKRAIFHQSVVDPKRFLRPPYGKAAEWITALLLGR